MIKGDKNMIKNLTKKEATAQEKKILKLIEKMEIKRSDHEFTNGTIRIYSKFKLDEYESYQLIVSLEAHEEHRLFDFNKIYNSYNKYDLINCMDYILRTHDKNTEYKIIHTVSKNYKYVLNGKEINI